jgi:cyclopropane fatty-acyl-phospholipid synthase-like methyltransferase
MADYRWNQAELAAAYDAAAPIVHPRYVEVQDQVLASLPFQSKDEVRLLDVGGGSGRLAERFLDAFPNARAVVLDQSQPFLALATKRLARFGPRADVILARLQDDWPAQLSSQPDAIVSTSAIHHLEPAEKRNLYQCCRQALVPGGVFINGDEIRDDDEAAYLAQLQTWAAHMQRLIADNEVSEPMAQALSAWQSRNIDHFQQPRRSGDDCHETIAAQLEYLQAAGFDSVQCPWRKDLWALLAGRKPLERRQ